MKTFCLLTLAFLSALFFPACSDETDELQKYVGPMKTAGEPAEQFGNNAVYLRHKETPLKILAIGNSFTHNAATYLPWMIDTLNADSICVAKLTRSGCSLDMHWTSHCDNTPDYDFFYSDAGQWHTDDIATIDDALLLFDWDIVVLQQVSGEAGRYSSYQPYLDNLVHLIRDTNPSAKLAWHYTWPYKEGTQHGHFTYYDNDPQKMYESILEACDMASEGFDIKIPSATLIWEMRQQYPEVEDKFSTDGYHISSDLALYALSTLWYECLVSPCTSTSGMTPPEYPEEIDPELFERARTIIATLTGHTDDDTTSVPTLRQ